MRCMQIQELAVPEYVARTPRSVLIARTLEPGEASCPTEELHPATDRWVIVLAGTGQAAVGARSIGLREGTLLLIEAGEPYRLVNSGDRPLETLSILARPAERSQIDP